MKRGYNDSWRRRDNFSSRKSQAYPDFVPEPTQISQIAELDPQSLNQCFRGYSTPNLASTISDVESNGSP
jgi:hypothetical protein